MSHQSPDTQLRHRRQVQAIQRAAVDGRFRVLRDGSGKNPIHQRTLHERIICKCLSQSCTRSRIARNTHTTTKVNSLQLNPSFQFSQWTHHHGRFMINSTIYRNRLLINNEQLQKATCIDIDQSSFQRFESAFNFCSSCAAQAAKADSEIRTLSSRDSIKGVRVSKASSPQTSSRHRFCSSGSNLFLGVSASGFTGSSRATGFPSRVMMISPSVSRERSASGQRCLTSLTVIVFMSMCNMFHALVNLVPDPSELSNFNFQLS